MYACILLDTYIDIYIHPPPLFYSSLATTRCSAHCYVYIHAYIHTYICTYACIIGRYVETAKSTLPAPSPLTLQLSGNDPLLRSLLGLLRSDLAYIAPSPPIRKPVVGGLAARRSGRGAEPRLLPRTVPSVLIELARLANPF